MNSNQRAVETACEALGVMTEEKWFAEARRAGEHWWSYRELVDDNPEGGKAAFAAGIDPFEYIKEEGQRLDLHEMGPAWGGW